MKQIDVYRSQMETRPRLEAVVQNQFVLLDILIKILDVLEWRYHMPIDTGEKAFKREIQKTLTLAKERKETEDLDSAL